MTTTKRSELLIALTELCQLYPNWRFGQLVANVAGWADKDVWEVDDDELLQALHSHLAHRSRVATVVANSTES